MSELTFMQLVFEQIAKHRMPPQFRALDEPPYKPAKVGEWRMVKKSYKAGTKRTGMVTGYWQLATKVQSMRHWVLFKGNTVWMSSTPMEMESQGYQARMAHGEVVVMGLGMGALVYNLLSNVDVTHITVVEKEAHVIELLRKAAPLWFFSRERLSIVEADALTYRHPGRIDTLIVDIWPTLGDQYMEVDMKAILDNNPDIGTVGWWGQELSIATWLGKNGYHAPITHEQLEEFQVAHNFRLLGTAHPHYPEIVLQALLTQSTIMQERGARE